MHKYQMFPLKKKSFKIKYVTITTLKFLVIENCLRSLAKDVLGHGKRSCNFLHKL